MFCRPTEDQMQRLVRHLRWARERYTEQLGNRNTFMLTEKYHSIIPERQYISGETYLR